jgi:ATP/maltotriose-dependent transcriptional regulator MalT
VSRTYLHAVNGSQFADVSSTVAAPCHARHTRDPGRRIEAGKAAAIPPAGQALTGAELRLLPLLSTHLSFPEIATELFLSRNTVRSQAISIYQKLGVSSRSQAVAAPYHVRHTRDPGRRIEAGRAATIPPAGQALTGAELRLLPLLSTHLSFPEIAGEFALSRNTVRSQAYSIYQKLGVSSRSQAVARSRELGLLEG